MGIHPESGSDSYFPALKFNPQEPPRNQTLPRNADIIRPDKNH